MTHEERKDELLEMLKDNETKNELLELLNENENSITRKEFFPVVEVLEKGFTLTYNKNRKDFEFESNSILIKDKSFSKLLLKSEFITNLIIKDNE